MAVNSFKYIWRCANCSNHFSNINNIEGILRQEKKCPKCKALNILKLSNKEILIQCQYCKSHMNHFSSEGNESLEY